MSITEIELDFQCRNDIEILEGFETFGNEKLHRFLEKVGMTLKSWKDLRPND